MFDTRKTVICAGLLAVIVACFGWFAASAQETPHQVKEFPVGSFCWDERYLPQNERTTIISKTDEQLVIRENHRDQPNNYFIATLVPAPEAVKPEQFRGFPGWCLIRMEQFRE